MPHLITIIKYARIIVKYLLVQLSALLERRMASCGERYKWFLLFGLASKMGSFGISWKWVCRHGGFGLGQAEACPTLSYSTGEGARRTLATSSSGRGRIYFVEDGVTI
jgi:hypothetical protein